MKLVDDVGTKAVDSVQPMMLRLAPRSLGRLAPSVLLVALASSFGCNADEPPPEGNEADQVGVAAQCQIAADCEYEYEHDTDTDTEPFVLECLTSFKGGYCGVTDCTSHEDCPLGSACVMHDDGSNYCFRLCVDKAECNLHRDADQEANCSSNIAYVGDDVGKACVPPEGD